MKDRKLEKQPRKDRKKGTGEDPDIWRERGRERGKPEGRERERAVRQRISQRIPWVNFVRESSGLVSPDFRPPPPNSSPIPGNALTIILGNYPPCTLQGVGLGGRKNPRIIVGELLSFRRLISGFWVGFWASKKRRFHPKKGLFSRQRGLTLKRRLETFLAGALQREFREFVRILTTFLGKTRVFRPFVRIMMDFCGFFQGKSSEFARIPRIP